MVKGWRNAAWSPRLPALIFLVALLARLGVLLAAESYRFDPTDHYREAGYETGRIAWNVAEGRGFSVSVPSQETDVPPTAWFAPAYPLIVAAFFRVFGSFTTTSFVLVLLFQAVLGSLAAAALSALGRRAAGPVAGLLAGLGLALWPTAIARDVAVIWGTTLFILLAIVLTIVALRWREKGGLMPLVAGLVGGLLLLTESVGVLFVAALALWLASDGGWRARRVGEVAVFGLITAILLMPWIVRNYAIYDHFIPLKSNFGNELFIGNHPGSDGSYVRIGEAIQVLPADTRQALREADEVEWNAILQREALRDIRADPTRFLRNTALRAFRFWTLPSYGPWERMRIGGWLGRATGAAYLAAHLLVFGGAAAGVFLALRRRRRELVPALLFLFAYPLPYYLTHVEIGRYRSPVFSFLLLFAAYFVVWGTARLRALRSSYGGLADSEGVLGGTRLE